MNLDAQSITSLIGIFGIILAFIGYRLNLANRRGLMPLVNADWSIPISINVFNPDNKKMTNKYIFFEGSFTNCGGKTVSLIEIIPKDGQFVKTLVLIQGQKLRTEAYKRNVRCFLLPKPAIYYINNNTISGVRNEQEARIDLSLPLNIAIEPGKTHRFTFVFLFPLYQKEKRKGYNTIIEIIAKFNNGQLSETKLAEEADITIAEK